MVISCDPGVRASGVAFFTAHGELDGVRLVRNQSSDVAEMCRALVNMDMPPRFAPTTVVVERPTVYGRGGRSGKGDPNDLISIAMVGGAFLAAWTLEGADARIYEPRTWKGSVKKEIHNDRVLAALSDDEIGLFETDTERMPRGLLHNAIDAVGLGLYFLKRG